METARLGTLEKVKQISKNLTVISGCSGVILDVLSFNSPAVRAYKLALASGFTRAISSFIQKKYT